MVSLWLQASCSCINKLAIILIEAHLHTYACLIFLAIISFVYCCRVYYIRGWIGETHTDSIMFNNVLVFQTLDEIVKLCNMRRGIETIQTYTNFKLMND